MLIILLDSMPRSSYSYDDQTETGGAEPHTTSSKDPFNMLSSHSTVGVATKTEHPNKPCRTCTDFRSWMKNKSGNRPQQGNDKLQISEEQAAHIERDLRACPLDKDELGASTWKFLHTMSVNYPDQPTIQEQADMKQFFGLFAKLYPCAPCAEDLRADLKTHPVRVESGMALAQWTCEAHNRVNKKLGKEEFDCKKVFERWRDGWKDGSCD